MKKMIFTLITEFELTLPFYAVGVGYSYQQENINRPNGSPYYQWIQCSKGKGELLIGENTYTVAEGQGMLLYPFEAHEYHSLTEVWEVDWIIFGGLHVEDFFLKTSELKKSGVYFVERPDMILRKIQQIYELETSDGSSKSLTESGLVYEILLDILRFSSEKIDNGLLKQYSRIKPLIAFIDKNYYKALTLPDLAEVLNITPQHLCSLFKNVTTQRIFEYINLTRVKKSKELLLQKEALKVKEISKLVGFEDVSYFCLVFKKIEKMSPNDFRKLHI